MFGEKQRGADKPLEIALIEREIEISNAPPRPTEWLSPAGRFFELRIPGTVYPPREDSTLLAQALGDLTQDGRIRLLEIGCGSGVISIDAHLGGMDVVCCDINPLAVAATRALAESRRAGQVNIIEAGLNSECRLDRVLLDAGPFDVIAWNLPYLDQPSQESRLGPLEEASLSDSSTREAATLGTALKLAIARDPAILSEKGVVLLICSDNGSTRELAAEWRRDGWASRVVGQARSGDDEVLSAIAFWRPWTQAQPVHLERVESTNTHLLDSELDVGTLLTCDEQIAGRGQRDRSWTKFTHGWAGSWVVMDEKPPAQLQLTAAVCVCDSIAALTSKKLPSINTGENLGPALELKWPNDVLLAGRKLCGILAQGRIQAESHRMVIGIGINLGELSKSERSIGIEAASLAEILDRPPSAEEWERVIHASIASWFEDQSLIGSADLTHCIKHWWILASQHLSSAHPRIDDIELRLTRIDADGIAHFIEPEERLDSSKPRLDSYAMEWTE